MHYTKLLYNSYFLSFSDFFFEAAHRNKSLKKKMDRKDFSSTILKLFGLKYNGYFLEISSKEPKLISKTTVFTLKNENQLFDQINQIPVMFSNEKPKVFDFQYITYAFDYEKYNLFCVFFPVLDVNNYGNENFTRILVFVIVSESSNLYGCDELIFIANETFNDNFQQFLKEVTTKIKSIQSHIKQDDLERFMSLAEELKIDLNDEKNIINDRFLSNNQRQAQELFKLEKIKTKFDDFLIFSSLSNDSTYFPQMKNDLGLAHQSLFHFLGYATSNEKNSLYIKLATSNALPHILYSLLSGRTLIVVAREIKDYISLCVNLSSFIPNFSVASFLCQEKVSPKELKNGMICICNEILEDEIEENDSAINNFSIISIEDNLYEGILCDYSSCVWRFSTMEKTQRAPSFVMSAYAIANKIFREINFIFAQLMEKVKEQANDGFSLTIYKIEIALKEKGYYSCDFPLFANLAQFMGYNEISKILKTPNTFQKLGSCFLSK